MSEESMSLDQQAQQPPAISESDILAILNKPDAEWTDDDTEKYLQYNAWKQRVAAEREERKKAQQAELIKEQEEASRRYYEKIAMLEERERNEKMAAEEARKEASLEWFIGQLKTPKRTELDLRQYADKVSSYLKAAYKAQVDYSGLAFKDDNYTKFAVESVSEWLLHRKKSGLILCGYIGVGKTTMLFAIAEVLRILTRKEMTIVSSSTISNYARDAYQKYTELSKCDFLGLDDLGTEPSFVKNYGNNISYHGAFDRTVQFEKVHDYYD